MNEPEGRSPHGILLTGGYDADGAYGPTIVLNLDSAVAATWLRNLFLAIRREAEPVDLIADPRVRLDGIKQLRLSAEDGVGPLVRLRRTHSGPDGMAFNWTGTSMGWAHEAGLLGPLADGRSGHQYLTSEVVDDALIEVALGEHPVLKVRT